MPTSLDGHDVFPAQKKKKKKDLLCKMCVMTFLGYALLRLCLFVESVLSFTLILVFLSDLFGGGGGIIRCSSGSYECVCVC